MKLGCEPIMERRIGCVACNTPAGLFDCLQSTAQSVHHSVSGGQLGIVVQMRVDVGCCREVAVSQPFLNLLHGNAVCKQK